MKKSAKFERRKLMKKFYKNKNSNRFTIENMATCIENCTIPCSCANGCGGSPANAAAVISVPSLGGGLDYDLVATGNIFG